MKGDPLVCGYCGEPFPRPNARGPVPKWCSDSHRQAAFRDRNFVASAPRSAEQEAKAVASAVEYLRARGWTCEGPKT